MPQIFLSSEELLSEAEFTEMICSLYATDEDLAPSQYRRDKVKEFQSLYLSLVERCSKLFQEDKSDTLLELSKRAHRSNQLNKVTGDAITHIVALLMKKRQSLSPEKVYELIQSIAEHQKPSSQKGDDITQDHPRGILKEMLTIIKDNREGI